MSTASDRNRALGRKEIGPQFHFVYFAFFVVKNPGPYSDRFFFKRVPGSAGKKSLAARFVFGLAPILRA